MILFPTVDDLHQHRQPLNLSQVMHEVQENPKTVLQQTEDEAEHLLQDDEVPIRSKEDEIPIMTEKNEVLLRPKEDDIPLRPEEYDIHIRADR